jgi:prepilin-type processing-associated H-X9-DG protein
MNKNTTAQGFTLNELLIALSIAMLLAAMVFPVLSRARAESEENICMNNLKQIGVALKMYAEDQGDGSVFPPAYNPSGIAGQGRYWADFLAPYAGAKGKYDKNARPCYINTVFDCPSLTEYTTNMPVDYAYFRVLWAYSGNAINDIKEIKKPQEVGIVADAEFFTDGTPPSARIGTPGVSNSRTILRNRHNNGVNILYCDGHVEHVPAQMGDNLRNIFDASKH